MEISSLEELDTFLKSDRFDFNDFQIISSKTPQDCVNQECILGVDEAGRGPVLGPMVYAVSYVPKKRASDLEDIGCADSKTLTEKKREELFSILCACEDYVGWMMDVISPNFISNNMLKRVKYSLNEIAQEATVMLIQKVIERNVNVTEIYVDTVGPPEKYQERLSKLFPGRKVTVAKKADSIYAIVSAASICAKVARDATLRSWRFSEGLTPGEDFGSGYPNDPQTKAFLKENTDDVFGYPRVVRFSWSTADKILEESTASVEWDSEDESEEGAKSEQKITSFFFKTPTSGKQEMKHIFFRQRNLASATRF